jgi:hypothetical protein
MKSPFVWIAFAIIAIAVAAALALHQRAGVPAAGHLPADAYPLYPGASWGSEQATPGGNGATDYAVSSAPFSDITDIASVTAPFLKYYDDKLAAAGWSVDTAREAGGPGSEIVPYLKAGQELIVSYSTDFKLQPAGAPEQCPCDTTLTLESVGP